LSILNDWFFWVFFAGIWSWLADKLHLILSYEAEFKIQPSSKSTLPLAGLEPLQQCQVNFYLSFLQVFDLMNGASKMGSSVGGLNPQPLSHESSALTTRPQLHAFLDNCLRFCLVDYVFLTQKY
jgi:hypothetical protein